ncbi:MAG TPA: DUF3784 domain-containing protein [Candidatus Scatomorpha merdigallinarum]|nr:DUF3784 domain-containing protein [Candidatus Scatomorpha merdigallinarum]
MNVNVGAISCGVFCALFLLLGAIFSALRERGVRLISGFGSLPPEKRALYDTERMWRDQRNNFFIWAAVFAVGAALSLLVSQGLAIAAFVVWLVLFLRDVHFDAEKAFAKYKK